MDKPDLYSTLLKLFFGAFGVLFVVGLATGGVERKDQVRATVLRGIAFSEGNANPLLAYRCHGETLSIFDLRSLKVVANPASLKDFQSTSAVFSLSSHRSALLAFAGGSTGAITLQSLARTPKGSGQIRSVLATIFGAVSGYLAGYWIATLSAETCDSDSAKALVSTDDFWKAASREILAIKLHELGYVDSRFLGSGSTDYERAFSFALDPIVRCKSATSAALARTVERLATSIQPTADDYLSVARFERLRIRLAANEPYRALKAIGEAPLSSINADAWQPRFAAVGDPFNAGPLEHERGASFSDFCQSLAKMAP